jgi:hypothetical protein
MDKSLGILFLQLRGHKAVFDGQVTGLFVLAVTWTKDIVGQVTRDFCLCSYLVTRH